VRRIAAGDFSMSSHPIDRYVGARMRLRRIELRLSQSALGAKIGVTFQAVQKYESGRVRVSAGRLYDVAGALGANPAFFFEGYGEDGGEDGAETPPDTRLLARRDVASLLSGYSRIRDPQLQADLRRLIATLGDAAA
jgi:transcriptional regulator with XRE-family HTH domain